MFLRPRTDSAELEDLRLEMIYWKERCELSEEMNKELRDENKYKDNKQEQGQLELHAENPYFASNKIANIKPSVMNIEKPNNGDNREEIDNSTIHKMIINHFDESWKNWFKVNNFKLLRELHINCSLYNVEGKGRFFNGRKELVFENMTHIFSGMRNLKHLHLRTEPLYYQDVWSSFELETADIENFITFSLSKNSLRDLKILRPLNCHTFKKLFEGYKNLEKLAVSVEVGRECKLTANKSIVNLEIFIENDEYGKREKDPNNFKSKFLLEELLKATPSLQILTLYNEITSSVLSLIVHNMKDLKKLICRGGIEEDIVELYEDMKKNEPGTNKDITITVEQTRTWTHDHKPTKRGSEMYR